MYNFNSRSSPEARPDAFHGQPMDSYGSCRGATCWHGNCEPKPQASIAPSLFESNGHGVRPHAHTERSQATTKTAKPTSRFSPAHGVPLSPLLSTLELSRFASFPFPGPPRAPLSAAAVATRRCCWTTPTAPSSRGPASALYPASSSAAPATSPSARAWRPSSRTSAPAASPRSSATTSSTTSRSATPVPLSLPLTQASTALCCYLLVGRVGNLGCTLPCVLGVCENACAESQRAQCGSTGLRSRPHACVCVNALVKFRVQSALGCGIWDWASLHWVSG